MLSEPLSLQWVKTGSAPVEHKISASPPKPDIYAHNPVQDALVLTKSASSKATSVCPHFPLINSRSDFVAAAIPPPIIIFLYAFDLIELNGDDVLNHYRQRNSVEADETAPPTRAGKTQSSKSPD